MRTFYLLLSAVAILSGCATTDAEEALWRVWQECSAGTSAQLGILRPNGTFEFSARQDDYYHIHECLEKKGIPSRIEQAK